MREARLRERHRAGRDHPRNDLDREPPRLDRRILLGELAPYTEQPLREIVIGGRKPLDGPIVIEEYDPEWPRRFEREEQRIRAALGDRAFQVEHAGSTSVPDLPAKPIIDIVLVVADTRDEDAYVPALEAAGYVLRMREP